MARTLLTPAVSTRSGVALPAAAPLATDLKFVNDGTQVLIVTGAVTVSLVIAEKVDGVTPAAKTVTVAGGQTKIIGPFPTGMYNQPGSEMFVDLTTVTDVTIGVVTVAGVKEG